MKQSITFLLFFGMLALSIILTGFQCGSTEMTSAKLAIQQENYARAEQLLNSELKKNPTNAEAWYLLGETQYKTAKFEEMLPSLKNAVENDKSLAEKARTYQMNAWVIVIKSGIESSGRLQKCPADSIDIYAKKAVKDYQLALKIAPDSIVSYQNMAVVYALTHDEDKQIEALENVRKLSKNEGATLDATNELVNIYIRKGDKALESKDEATATQHFTKALDEITKLRQADPENKDILRTMLDLYTKMGKQDEALTIVNELVQKEPDEISYKNHLAFLLSKKGDLTGALEQIEKVLKIDPDNVDALNNGGLLYDRLGDKMKSDAEAEAEKAKGKKVDKAYIEKFKRSSELFRHLTTLKPNDANIFEALASALLKSNMTAEAKKVMEQADAIRKKQ